MLGRLIVIDTGWQTVSAAQDLLEVKLGSGQAGYVLGVKIMQSSDEASTEAEELQVALKKATSNFTSGSGGGTATVVTASSSLAHGLTTIERNNTTQASSNGTAGTLEVMEPGAFNVLAGEWEATFTPELMEKGKVGPSEAAILSLDEAPADAITARAIMNLLLTHG